MGDEKRDLTGWEERKMGENGTKWGGNGRVSEKLEEKGTEQTISLSCLQGMCRSI